MDASENTFEDYVAPKGVGNDGTILQSIADFLMSAISFGTLANLLRPHRLKIRLDSEDETWIGLAVDHALFRSFKDWAAARGAQIVENGVKLDGSVKHYAWVKARDFVKPPRKPEKPDMPSAFDVGDVVMLKSGGAMMTVIGGPECGCVEVMYDAYGEIVDHTIPIECLQKVPPDVAARRTRPNDSIPHHPV